MNGQQIGIKLADGSFYPVLSESDLVRKKLVVTTVRDNQETVQIDLYRGEGQIAEEADYIGTLMIENIQPEKSRAGANDQTDYKRNNGDGEIGLKMREFPFVDNAGSHTLHHGERGIDSQRKQHQEKQDAEKWGQGQI